MKLRQKIPMMAAGLLTLGLVIGAATTAGAAANVNFALAITGGPYKTSVHTSYQTDNAAGLTVTDANRAQAVSVSCVGCKTVAIAVQVDLAAGPVVNIRASNKAIAQTRRGINDDTCASAYQFIVAPNEMVVFSPSGKAGIAAIESLVSAESRSGDSCAVITEKVDAAMGTMANLLLDSSSYIPGNPGSGGIFPHLSFNRDHQAV